MDRVGGGGGCNHSRNSFFLSQICVRDKGEFRSHSFMANKTVNLHFTTNKISISIAISCLGNTGL